MINHYCQALIIIFNHYKPQNNNSIPKSTILNHYKYHDKPLSITMNPNLKPLLIIKSRYIPLWIIVKYKSLLTIYHQTTWTTMKNNYEYRSIGTIAP